MKSKSNKRSLQKSTKSSSESSDYLDYTPNGRFQSTKKLGAKVFYILSSRNKPLDYFYQKKFNTRNFLVGYLIYIITIFLILGIFVINEMKNQDFF